MQEDYKRFDMDSFFSAHPVFRRDELKDYRAASGATSSRTIESLLGYYQRSGRIESIRQGVYAVVPRGVPRSESSTDPLLIAGRCVPDAVIVNHSALEFHALAYSQFRTYTFQTASTTRSFEYKGSRFVPLSPPSALKRTNSVFLETTTGERFGLSVIVSSIERTLVAVINSPRWSGSWEEVWRSLDSIEYLNPERVLTYLRAIDNATTAARVGWFLDSRREQLMIEDKHLDEIHAMQPSRPVYFDRTYSGQSRFVPEWNLVVPAYVAEGAWEEPA